MNYAVITIAFGVTMLTLVMLILIGQSLFLALGLGYMSGGAVLAITRYVENQGKQ